MRRASLAVTSAPDTACASTTSTASASAATIRLREGNCLPRGGVPGGNSESRPPVAGDLREQGRVAVRIDDVDAAAEHGKRRRAAIERAPMRGRVDPQRTARNDGMAAAATPSPPAPGCGGIRHGSPPGRPQSPAADGSDPGAGHGTRAPPPVARSGAEHRGNRRPRPGREGLPGGQRARTTTALSAGRRPGCASKDPSSEPLQIAPLGGAVKQRGKRPCNYATYRERFQPDAPWEPDDPIGTSTAAARAPLQLTQNCPGAAGDQAPRDLGADGPRVGGRAVERLVDHLGGVGASDQTTEREAITGQRGVPGHGRPTADAQPGEKRRAPPPRSPRRRRPRARDRAA